MIMATISSLLPQNPECGRKDVKLCLIYRNSVHVITAAKKTQTCTNICI